MAKLIYSIMISLMQDQNQQFLQGTITTKHQLPKIREFVTFATTVYSPWWLTCSFAVDAPWNDVNLYKQLLLYSDVNSSISASAVKAMKHHLWYLTEELIPLALFSEKVSAAEKQALATKLLAVKPDMEVITPSNRYGTGLKKKRVSSPDH